MFCFLSVTFHYSQNLPILAIPIYLGSHLRIYNSNKTYPDPSTPIWTPCQGILKCLILDELLKWDTPWYIYREFASWADQPHTVTLKAKGSSIILGTAGSHVRDNSIIQLCDTSNVRSYGPSTARVSDWCQYQLFLIISWVEPPPLS